MRGGGCDVSVEFAFARHDADGDGKIDAQKGRELLAAMRIEGVQRGRLFENIDGDHDGKITVEEWEKL